MSDRAADPTAVDPAVQVVQVSKTFPGQKALDDVSLTVNVGEVHALVGENGSGKSTLIRILGGNHLPDPGASVFVCGTPLPLGSPSASFDLGLRFVHQKLGLIPELNAVENIALETGFARGGFIDWRAQERVTGNLLKRLRIEVDMWRPLGDCTPVERSAVAIARAMRTRDPNGILRGDEVPAVVLDEPTASLGAADVQTLFGIIRDLASNGVAVIYVSHRLDEVFEIADRVSVLRNGRLQATTEREELTRSRLIELILGRKVAESGQRRAAALAPSPSAELVHPRLAVRGLRCGRIDDVSLAVSAGEILGVAGISGSGREDLARALVGATTPDQGAIAVDGSDVGDITPRNLLGHGVMFAPGNTQAHSAVGQFSVQENLTMATLGRHGSFGRLRRRSENVEAQTWIGSLDVRPPDPDRLYTLLSGGNQQKVILGKWLNADPKVLTLDEPTAGVDVGARQGLYDLVSRQAAAGLAVVVCSSDLEDIVSLCHRAIVMRNGRVATELAGNELTEHRLLLESVGDAPRAASPRS